MTEDWIGKKRSNVQNQYNSLTHLMFEVYGEVWLQGLVFYLIGKPGMKNPFKLDFQALIERALGIHHSISCEIYIRIDSSICS